MQRKTIEKIIVAFLLAILVIISSSNSFAEGTGTSGIQPSQITGKTDGKELDIELGFIKDVTELVRTVGNFIAVGVLMVIGIRYMMGSVEERASYKKSMMPYIIGCFILFGAANIAPQFEDIFSDLGDNTEEIGNKILGLIQVIGTFISVGALMIMGIRYMMGSVEERASYKKSMVPYVVGAVLLFAAVNLVTIIYNMVPKEEKASETGYFESSIVLAIK